MSLFGNLTSSVNSAVNSVTKNLSSVASSITDPFKNVSTPAGALKAVSSAAKAINNLANPTTMMSAIRSANVPTSAAGGPGSAFAKTSVSVAGQAADWRVRLSLPPNFFQDSPVFAPLMEAGGLVFPYTPTINITHSASYDDVGIIHQNYQFLAYQNSKLEAINISGPFNVEDYAQAQYWLAALHFLRSATKMYTGDTASHGSPPPIVFLDGYGDFVFKHVPVIIKSFTLDMPADVDYIATTVGDSDSNASKKSHVPVKSTLSVSVQPVYSREQIRTFSLETFVNGGYMSDKGEFI
jgi:hypothetical protein